MVDALNLTAAGGSVVGLLGPNGCGKSTTMKMLAGVLASSSGSFTLNGEPGGVDRLKVKQRIGYIPDVGGLFPRLSGWEHLELAARLFGLKSWKPRAHQLLDELDMMGAAGERAGQYSHGMSRKLSAALALLPAPTLLLADEPFDGVDQSGVKSLSAMLRRSASEGSIVLVTTHLLDVAQQLCDDVHLMKDGRTITTWLPGDSLPALYEQHFPPRVGVSL